MRVCITGGSGTLGHYLLRLLSAQRDVTVMSMLRSTSAPAADLPRIHTTRVDFGDRDALVDTVRAFDPDAIVHAAASGMKESERADPSAMTRFNLDSTLGLLQAAAERKGCHYIYLSTGLAYLPQGRALVETDPLGSTHPYGASKAATERQLRDGAGDRRVPLTVFRPFSFTGINDHTTRLFPMILNAAAAGAPARLSNPDQIRDFIAAEDVAAAILLALRAPAGGGVDGWVRVYNLGSGSRLTVRRLVERVARDLALEVEFTFAAGTAPGTPPPMLTADATSALESLAWRPRVSLSYAVWELARSRYPDVNIQQPDKWL